MAAELPAPLWISKGRIPAIDGLRAVAIAFVILAHVIRTHGFYGGRWTRYVTAANATLGVDLFFVLSGLLITTLLFRERDRSGGISLRAFYVRRVLRIFPAYMAYLGAIVGLQFAGIANVPRADWIAAATYTMNFREGPAWEVGHAWSLSIEEHFYLVWPWPFSRLARSGALHALFGALAVCVASRFVILFMFPRAMGMIDLWTFTRLDAIVMGCMLAVLARDDVGRRHLDRAARLWPLALVGIVIARVGANLSGKFDGFIAPPLTASSLAVLVWSAVRAAPRFLESKAMVTIGIGSYSLYLWQELFLNPNADHWWTRFPQNLALAALGAAFSYHVVEKPFLRLKERFAA
jgi:peptidoglycan/LPS O-acetylase OafA/YrhL